MTARFAFPYGGQQCTARTAAQQTEADRKTAHYAALVDGPGIPWRVHAACTALLDQISADARANKQSIIDEHGENPKIRRLMQPEPKPVQRRR